MKNLFFMTFIGMMSIQMSKTQRKPPNYSLDAMPVTDFDCSDKVVGGYYADPQTECQMFHVCTDISGVLQDFRFLCPNNTAFDQENQICDDWYNIDCEAATLFYSDNFDLFRIDADTRSNSIVNKVTPIPLGPSTSAKPKVVKPKKPFGPVNNAVSDDEDDLFLQKADTGDKRLHQDLLRGSSSSNFFENKNRGREDFDDDVSGQRKSNFIKPTEDLNKKKTKVAVRKLLTGKRPVSPKAEPTTEVPPTTTQNYQPSTTNYQNNYFQKTKYNTVSRNRDSATASTRAFDASTTAAPSTPNSRVFNNNFSQKQYNYFAKTTAKSNNGQSTVGPPHFKSRGSVNYSTYLKSQTNNDYVDIPKPSSPPAPVYNPQQTNNQNKQSQTPAPYNSPDITQAYFNTNNNNNNNYQTPSVPSNQKTPVYQKPQPVNNYQQPQVTNNYQQPQQVTNNYQQQQQTNVNYQPFNPSAPADNYFQKTTQSVQTPQPTKQNYQQPSTAQQQSYQQSSTAYQPSPAVGQNYQQQPTASQNYQQPSTVSQNFQQPSTANQFYQPSTVSPTTQSPSFNNYYQQYSMVPPSSVYQTSTSFAFAPSSTQAPPPFQKLNYFQPKKDYSPKAQIPPVYQFNPSEDKYEENNPDEFLKTAPSSNLRPSDINALHGSFNKPSVFNTSVSASFKFSQNSVSKSSTVNAYTPSSTKAPIYANSVSYNQPPVRSSPKPFTLPVTTTHAPRPVTNAPLAPIKVANQPQPNLQQFGGSPNQPQAGGKDDYDYAYYDDGATEYEGVEPIQEEFHKTKTIKKA